MYSNQNLKKKISFKVSKQEAEKIRVEAAYGGYSVSEYCRSIILGPNANSFTITKDQAIKLHKQALDLGNQWSNICASLLNNISLDNKDKIRIMTTELESIWNMFV